jgi:histidyl-tRNA synthetase
MELAPPRGTDDLLPPLSERMLSLYEDAHRQAELFGFRYVETPTFEHTELFARTSGGTSDVVTKEMYTFEDKGGRSITLRPENTAGVVRAYLSHSQELGSPFKGYYVGSQFRHGRPQAGRTREFRQFGVEVLGVAAPAADIEVIRLGDSFARDHRAQDAKLLLNSIGDRECRPAYREKLIAHLEPHEDQLDEDCRTRLRQNPLRVFDCKVDGQKDFVLQAPTIADSLCEACTEHFSGVKEGLRAAGISFELDPRLVRGLDYYTRTTFEWVSGRLSSGQSTFNAGGRYDALAEELGGPPTPGVGFALGLDRLLLSMPEAEPAPRRLVFVIAIGAGAREAGESLVVSLRSANVPADMAYEDRPLKAQLKMAARAEAAWAAILGERELETDSVTLRDMTSGSQEEIGIGELPVRLGSGP